MILPQLIHLPVSFESLQEKAVLPGLLFPRGKPGIRLRPVEHGLKKIKSSLDISASKMEEYKFGRFDSKCDESVRKHAITGLV